MLHLMRKHAGSLLIKVALGIIVVVFVFWGLGSYRERKGNRVAVVDGAVITMDEYRTVYERLLDRYRSQFGGALNDEILKSLNVKKQALEDLISRQLLLQEAARRKLQVTNEDLARAIQNIGAFQSAGRFDPELYRRLLAANRMTPEMFEETLRMDLLVENLQNIVLTGVKVSDQEAYEAYRWREAQADVDYVVFAPTSFKDVEANDKEIETYFSEHKQTYETPPQVKTAYCRFLFKDFEPQVELSEEDVREYFELNKDQYGQPKKVHARHILFKADEKGADQQVEASFAKALKVLQEAKSGKDFAKLAEEYSDDPGSKTKGGDLGFFAENQMVKPFTDAAFSLKPGEISEPVKTRFGWHLIKVEEVQEAKEPVFDEVKEQIRKKLVEDGAKESARDQAEAIYEASFGAGHLADMAESKKLEVKETDFFSRNAPAPEIPQGQKFAKAAFGLPDGEVGEPLDLGDGYYLMEVTGRKPAQVPELGAVKDKVRQDLLQSKRDEMTKAVAQAFLEALKGGAEIGKEAKARNLEVKSSGFFKRSGAIPGMGPSEDFISKAFSLSASNPLPDEVIQGNEGYYVMRFKAYQEPARSDFDSAKSALVSELVAQKRQSLAEEWLGELRRKSEIVIEEGFLD